MRKICIGWRVRISRGETNSAAFEVLDMLLEVSLHRRQSNNIYIVWRNTGAFRPPPSICQQPSQNSEDWLEEEFSSSGRARGRR